MSVQEGWAVGSSIILMVNVKNPGTKPGRGGGQSQPERELARQLGAVGPDRYGPPELVPRPALVNFGQGTCPQLTSGPPPGGLVSFIPPMVSGGDIIQDGLFHLLSWAFVYLRPPGWPMPPGPANMS